MRAACASCGTPLSGRFCAQCGEKTLESADLDWRHYLLEELPHQLFHLDGKLPRTLKSLFTRPGQLAEDFVAGRRQPFVGPLRLYLIVFIAYAVTAGLTGADQLSLPERAALVDPTHLLERLLHARASIAWSDPAVEARIAARAKWLSEAGTFVIYLFVALFQRLIFARLKRRYLEHLVLALNVLTFYLLINAFGQLFILWIDGARLAYAEGMLQSMTGFFVLPVYWYFSIRRFYGLRRSWA
ncbi:MAG TPA: DUF3667 domain-containing protein, partial [Steroidobacteraceae bacterium]